MVLGGVVDGIICRTQHLLRVCCWLLVFATMVLLCLKVDYGYNSIRWMMIVSPIVAVLSVASASLIYIVYGHQVGYYRLTESQLTAGNLYSLAALISIVLVVVIGEVIPLARPVEIETRVFVVLMAPLVVVLLGMGAWVVSRDEFGRLLLYGGQAQVHPRKLRWEAGGWTSVQGRGVTTIPLFGEVRYENERQMTSCCCWQGLCGKTLVHRSHFFIIYPTCLSDFGLWNRSQTARLNFACAAHAIRTKTMKTTLPFHQITHIWLPFLRL